MISTNMFIFSTYDEHIFKEITYLLEEFILKNTNNRYSTHSSTSNKAGGLKSISLSSDKPYLFKKELIKYLSQNDGKIYEELSNPIINTNPLKDFLEILCEAV